MPTLKEAAADFLAQRRIAVAGVSRDAKQPANANYRKLRATGHQVFAVNPQATTSLEGDACYPSLRAIPGGVDAALVFTPAAAAAAVVRECAELHIPRVWLHQGLGPGSVSDEAVALARQEGIALIAGACPMMFVPGADPFHRCARVIKGWVGTLPEGTDYVVGGPVQR